MYMYTTDVDGWNFMVSPTPVELSQPDSQLAFSIIPNPAQHAVYKGAFADAEAFSRKAGNSSAILFYRVSGSEGEFERAGVLRP